MKIGIYASMDAGHVKDNSIEFIGVDQGVMHLLKQGICPKVVIGDMDSIEDKDVLKGLNVIEYSCIKDDTDTALAIEYAIKKGYNNIDLYGVTQGRMDHFMAVISLLEKYQDFHIVIYDKQNKIQILKPGTHVVLKDKYDYFSVFSFDESYITLKDCHYELENYLLKRNDPLCVSNQMNQNKSTIINSKSVLFIQSK